MCDYSCLFPHWVQTGCVLVQADTLHMAHTFSSLTHIVHTHFPFIFQSQENSFHRHASAAYGATRQGRDLQWLCCFPPHPDDTKHSLLISLLFPVMPRQCEQTATTAPIQQNVRTCGEREEVIVTRPETQTQHLEALFPSLPLYQTDGCRAVSPQASPKVQGQEDKVLHHSSFPLCQFFSKSLCSPHSVPLPG